MVVNGAKRSLVLLQVSPSDLSFANVKAAYEPPLHFVLHAMSQASTNRTLSVLDVGIRCAIFPRPGYTSIQHLLALVYKLLSSLSKSLSIGIEHENDVEFQIFFYQSSKQPHEGTVTRRFANIDQIARLSIPWTHIFVPQGESSEDVLRDFMESRSNLGISSQADCVVTRVPGGLSMISEHQDHPSSEELSFWPSHASVAVGGTFDHLHAGHKLLLSVTVLSLSSTRQATLEQTKRHLIIGITGDAMLKNKKFLDELEDWKTRQAKVQEFLLRFLLLLAPDNRLAGSHSQSQAGSGNRLICNELESGIQISYVEIFDPFGPTVTDPSISALILSGETRSGGQAVNEKRAEKNWHPLEVLEIDVLDPSEGDMQSGAEDFQDKISSTEIRSRIHQHRVTIRR